MTSARLEFTAKSSANAPAIILWSAFIVLAVSAVLQVRLIGGFVDLTSSDPTVQAGLRAGGLVLGLFASSQFVEAVGRITRPYPTVVADEEGLTITGHFTILWSEFHHAEEGETKGDPHLAVVMRDVAGYQRRQPLIASLLSRLKRAHLNDRIVLSGALLTEEPKSVADKINAFYYAVMRARVAGEDPASPQL